MKKIKILSVLVLCVFLVACAGWQTNMTRAYKGIGALGETYRQMGQSSCEQNLIPTDKCVMLKKINNDARGIWLRAGDILKLAIKTQDAIQQQQFLAQYNSLMADFNKLFTEFVKLLTDLKVIKKGDLNGIYNNADRYAFIESFRERSSDH